MRVLRRAARKSVDDFRSRGLWRAVVAEFLGTLLLVFFSAMPVLDLPDAAAPSTDAKLLRAGFAAGFIVTALIWSLGHVSGAHVNPAVSLAFAVTGKVSILRAVLYIPAQCGGSVGGAMLLKLLSPVELRNSSLGTNEFNAELMHPAQAYGVEFVLTFMMLLTIMASTDSLRFDTAGSIPVVVGLQVVVCNLSGGAYSGSSMNPTRSLGPAIAAGRYQQLWVHVAGPISGGVTGGIVYHLLFRGKYMLSKAAAKAETEVYSTEL